MSSVVVTTGGHAYGEPSEDFAWIMRPPVTLARIAKAYYGEHWCWRYIAAANGMDWQPNRPLSEWVDLFHGGHPTRLTVPQLPGDA